MPQLEVTDLQFAYPDGHRAIDRLSFSADTGESIGLVGANGAGKSTLLLLLTGVLEAQAGSITINNLTLSKHTRSAVRRAVGLVFQDADDQLFCSSVFEDVAFGPRNAGLAEDAIEEAVAAALEVTGIAALHSRAPYRLSGGEKRLAAIASVLSMNPSLLIMDEPSASLDPRARRRMIELLLRLPQTRFITSHDLDLVWDVCQRVIVLKDGKIAADGPAKTVLRDQALLEDCGLELPLRLQHTDPPVC